MNWVTWKRADRLFIKYKNEHRRNKAMKFAKSPAKSISHFVQKGANSCWEKKADSSGEKENTLWMHALLDCLVRERYENENENEWVMQSHELEQHEKKRKENKSSEREKECVSEGWKKKCGSTMRQVCNGDVSVINTNVWYILLCNLIYKVIELERAECVNKYKYYIHITHAHQHAGTHTRVDAHACSRYQPKKNTHTSEEKMEHWNSRIKLFNVFLFFFHSLNLPKCVLSLFRYTPRCGTRTFTIFIYIFSPFLYLIHL